MLHINPENLKWNAASFYVQALILSSLFCSAKCRWVRTGSLISNPFSTEFVCVRGNVGANGLHRIIATRLRVG